MGSLFAAKSSSGRTGPATSLRVQTALQGQPISILLGGKNRLAGNLIDYVDFTAIPSGKSAGGKGVGGGGGKGTNQTSYTYTVAPVIAICEGPVASIDAVWNNKTKQTLDSLNLTAFLGTYSQTAWGYMSSLHPERALNYRGLAYVAAGPMDLGNSQELPNMNFEVTAVFANAISSSPDADPKDCLTELLTNSHFGIGFPLASLGDLSVFSAYARATGMVTSPVITNQTDAAQFIRDYLIALNSEAVWSGEKLNIVPYGDEDITANGATYTAPAAPEYDLTDDDFLPNESSNGADPIIINRKRVSKQDNSIPVEYLDRANDYNPTAVTWKDDALIQQFGLRQAQKRSCYFFCTADAATMSAALLGGRQQVLNTYSFVLGPKFILLDPMDIVTLTQSQQGLNRKWVRITEIQENDDGSFNIAAEDYLGGTGAAPLYGAQANSGHVPDYNIAPGNVNTPLIFEPTDELGAGQLKIAMALSGQNPANWGGCDVYISYDGDTYLKIDRQLGPARQGRLTAALPSFPANPTGQTIDTVNTASVDLSESDGELLAGSQLDATALNTLCYVDGEYISYQNSVLTGANKYDLSYLVRGAYGTEDKIANHAIGSQFCRVDDSLFQIPYTQDRIGATVYLKFLSFNIYGGAQQSLADVAPFAYKIQGTALSSPLPDVQNLRSVYVDNQIKLEWDEIEDFRPVRYEIRQGSTWDGGLTIGNVAHPPFVVFGNGNYMVKGISQPVPGLTVYSEDAASANITGAILVQNVVATYDEQALGWLGTLDGVVKDGDTIRTDGNEEGTYTPLDSHVIDVGYARPTLVSVNWKGVGVPVGQNILALDDYLNQPDILGSASTAFVEVFPEIRVAQSITGDVFEAPDIFAVGDIFLSGIEWGPWTKFVPGVYVGRLFQVRLRLRSNDPNTYAVALNFSYTVDVPDRIDTFTNLSLDAGGTVVQFAPNGLGVPTPFNGGPDEATVPLVQVTVLNGQDGDVVKVTGVSLSQCTVQVTNGGVGAARNVNLTAQGW